MQMRQCAQGGHYYDASVHAQCPYCTPYAAGSAPAPAPFGNDDIGQTMPIMQASSDIGKTMPMTKHEEAAAADMKTVALVRDALGFEPVVGWLVVLEGKEKGRDYRIQSDNNFIGRSDKMDICIAGDDTITRDNHATVSYDSRERFFYLSPGDGKAIVRINEKALFGTAKLAPYDVIEVGKTKLIFMPLCSEKFEWA